jgi:hypothetical protein
MDEVNEEKASRVCVGYNPWVIDEVWDGGQLLVSIFVDEDGMMMVQVARRDSIFDTWSPPKAARHG